MGSDNHNHFKYSDSSGPKLAYINPAPPNKFGVSHQVCDSPQDAWSPEDFKKIIDGPLAAVYSKLEKELTSNITIYQIAPGVYVSGPRDLSMN